MELILRHPGFLIRGAVAVLVVIGGTYLQSAKPLGRGIMLISAIASYGAALIHHIILLHGLRNSNCKAAAHRF